MIIEALKIFDNPKNPMETDTSEFIKPLIDEAAAKNIVDNKLTLDGCMKFCFEKGKKFEAKSGNHGFAMITPQQHFEWCCEYFGVKMPRDFTDPTQPTTKTAPAAINVDFDSLFN